MANEACLVFFFFIMSEERLVDKVKYIFQNVLREKVMARKRRIAGRQEGREKRKKERKKENKGERGKGRSREEEGQGAGAPSQHLLMSRAQLAHLVALAQPFACIHPFSPHHSPIQEGFSSPLLYRQGN